MVIVKEYYTEKFRAVMRAGGMHSGNVTFHKSIRMGVFQNLYQLVASNKITQGLGNTLMGHALGSNLEAPATAPNETARKHYGAENALACSVNSAAIATSPSLRVHSDQNMFPSQDADEENSSSGVEPGTVWNAVLRNVIGNTPEINAENVIADPRSLDDSLNNENGPMLQRAMRKTHVTQIDNWQFPQVIR